MSLSRHRRVNIAWFLIYVDTNFKTFRYVGFCFYFRMSSDVRQLARDYCKRGDLPKTEKEYNVTKGRRDTRIRWLNGERDGITG